MHTAMLHLINMSMQFQIHMNLVPWNHSFPNHWCKAHWPIISCYVPVAFLKWWSFLREPSVMQLLQEPLHPFPDLLCNSAVHKKVANHLILIAAGLKAAWLWQCRKETRSIFWKVRSSWNLSTYWNLMFAYFGSMCTLTQPHIKMFISTRAMFNMLLPFLFRDLCTLNCWI